MTTSDIVEIHNLVALDSPESYIPAAKYLFDLAGKKVDLNPYQAKQALTTLFLSFLNTNQYTEAALLAWGKIKFNPEPMEVQRIWDARMKYHKNLFMGAGSLGKTYCNSVFDILDYARDPKFTNKKNISTTEGHAKQNTWATTLDFHKSSIVPIPGKPLADAIVYENSKDSAITIVAIPEGDDGKGRLQGFHPKPRIKSHPEFGSLTRVSAYVDEAEKVPNGLWVGIDNLLTAQTEWGSVRITGATNPEDQSSPFAQRAEPPDGWDSIDEDKDFEWESRMGWHVTRLDAKYSENVKQKKIIYPGLQTYLGFMDLVKLGHDHPRYWTFGRGMYPKGIIEYSIVAPHFLTKSKQLFNFIGLPENVASLDPAFAIGGDNPYLAAGRFGIADGYINRGQVDRFTPRYVLQVEQLFPIKKGLTPTMADDIMTLLKMLKVRPEGFVMDKTGNGLGLHDTIKYKLGDVTGIQWSEGATERKILAEDTLTAAERYKGIDTELWFAFAKWLEYDYIRFSPILDTVKLFQQLSSRRYKRAGKLYRAESKDEYKSRTSSSSPDEADAVIMLVHVCRRLAERPSMIPPRPPRQPQSDWEFFDNKNQDDFAIPFIEFKD